MAYALYDFVETSRALVGNPPPKIAHVVASWGEQGDYAEWVGGFLVALDDGRFAYITGWCDTTGWGCQDGVDVTYFDTRPALSALDRNSDYNTDPISWDLDPADLNAWIAAGSPDPWSYDPEGADIGHARTVKD